MRCFYLLRDLAVKRGNVELFLQEGACDRVHIFKRRVRIKGLFVLRNGCVSGLYVFNGF